MLAYTSDTSADYWPILVVEHDAARRSASIARRHSEMPARLPSSAVLQRMIPLRRP